MGEPATDDEADLVRKCRTGDEDAWRLLYSQHWERTRNLARSPKFHLSFADAQDIAQRVMIDLWRTIMDNKLRGRVGGYVAEVTHNKCVDLIRKKDPIRGAEWTEGGPEAPDPFLTIPAPVPLPINTFEPTVLAELKAILAGIKDECRSLLSYRFSSGMAYRELAAACHIPEPQVGMRLKRCLSGLREILKKRPGLADELKGLP